MLVRKKDENVRTCVELRKLNLLTKQDCFALPRLDGTLDALAGPKYFYSTDLLAGYN